MKAWLGEVGAWGGLECIFSSLLPTTHLRSKPSSALFPPFSWDAVEEDAPPREEALASCILTCACFLFYRKKCVLAGGPRFVPAHPFYQKSRPRSCQQCLRESHPTILWICERGLTTDVAFPAPRTIHRKAWHTVECLYFYSKM